MGEEEDQNSIPELHVHRILFLGEPVAASAEVQPQQGRAQSAREGPLLRLILLRIRTVPGKQWVVGRAFNRLVSNAFHKYHIAVRDPSPMVITSPLPPTV